MTFFSAEKFFDTHQFVCCNCGKDIFVEGEFFCEDCLRTLPFNNGKTCKLCGAMIEGDHDYCELCKPKRSFFDQAFSSFDYVGVMRKLIKNFKYGNSLYVADVLSKYMTETLLAAQLQIDCVVAVPLSPKSKRIRGYNQSLVLAQKICEKTNLPLIKDGVAKIKETQQQEKLSFFERRQNLLGAFEVMDKTLFEGKNVLIIDDVKTTGTTLNRLAKALKKCKAKKVYGLTAVSVKEKISVTKVKKKRTILRLNGTARKGDKKYEQQKTT